MAPTSLWDRRSQRSIPVALIALAVLLLIARIVSSQIGEKPAPAPAAEVASTVRWVPIANARAVSAKSGKPVMYDFTAEWCPPCHALEDAVFRNARLAAMINEKFVPVRVMDRMREDGTNNPAVAALQSQYNVSAFPTIVFADATGAPKQRVEGFAAAEAFESVMKSVAR